MLHLKLKKNTVSSFIRYPIEVSERIPITVYCCMFQNYMQPPLQASVRPGNGTYFSPHPVQYPQIHRCARSICPACNRSISYDPPFVRRYYQSLLLRILFFSGATPGKVLRRPSELAYIRQPNLWSQKEHSNNCAPLSCLIVASISGASLYDYCCDVPLALVGDWFLVQ